MMMHGTMNVKNIQVVRRHTRLNVDGILSDILIEDS
jgi:hypothetical protein